MAGSRLETERLARRRARQIGAVGFAAAAALPVLLWHRVIADIASQFELSARYLVTGWSPWLLMLAGLGCLAYAGVAEWRDRERRFYTTGTAAWFGWGVTLYLLGFALATQVAQIAQGLSAA
jgi:hypothetical protein